MDSKAKDNDSGLYVLQKQVREKPLFDTDFSEHMRKGDSIDSIVLTEVTNMGQVAGSSDVVIGTPVFSGSLVQVRVEGGQNLENYKITHVITTTPSGDTLEGDGMLYVRDR